MTGIVIASHGSFAEGVVDTVKMLVGDFPQCRTACLIPGMTPEEFDRLLEEAVDAVDTGDGVLIFADLRSGTPYNRSVGLKGKGKNVDVLYGTSIPMVLELALDRDYIREDLIKHALENAAEGAGCLEFKDTSDEDDDF